MVIELFILLAILNGGEVRGLALRDGDECLERREEALKHPNALSVSECVKVEIKMPEIKAKKEGS